MMNIKRVAVAIIIGILTGFYCAGSLLLSPPPGVTPALWFVVMIFYGRVLQEFAIGITDGIALHPALRGAGLGAIISLMLAIVPLSEHNVFGAMLLFIFGIIYGIIADVVATWVCKKAGCTNRCFDPSQNPG
jgi:hypothetical protein